MKINAIKKLFTGAEVPKHTGIKLGQYGLRIPESLAITPGNNLLKHAQQYTLLLVNDSTMRCNCGVWIDGHHVGTWRLNRASNALLERPVSDPGRFTFYALGTEDARMAGLSSDNPSMGLVSAVFVPEMQRCTLNAGQRDDEIGARGGTGYSGISNQAFTEAEDIELDQSKATTLTIRLWCVDKPRPLAPAIQVGSLI